MENIILLYNPRAGNALFHHMLDFFFATFTKKNFEIRVFRSMEPGDLAVYLGQCSLQNTRAIFVAGGDGSVHEVVNALMPRHCQIPIGIIPAGTDNDFAGKLGLSKDVEQAILQLAEMKTAYRDIGEANGQYFVYECVGGSMADVGTGVSMDMKNSMGKSAYYLKGVRQLPKTRRFHVVLREKELVAEEDLVYFHIRLQGNGKLIFWGVPTGLSKMIFASKKMKRIELSSFILETDELLTTNLDGEVGPKAPIHVSVHPNALQFIVRE